MSDRSRVPGSVSVSFRLRLGVYWDEHGFERPCGIVEMVGVDESRSRLMVLDVRTGERILDPVEAIPIITK